MIATALWRRLDTPGHDAARATEVEGGWLLTGHAVFRSQGQPAAVSYLVTAGEDWSAERGLVTAHFGDRDVYRDIQRRDGSWWLNDVRVPGVDHCLDLDFGFTPATNFQQLKRIALRVGDRAEFDVAWLDDEADTLSALPQVYERRTETTYWYESPQGPYTATLEIAPSGFVRVYPGLWEMEA